MARSETKRNSDLAWTYSLIFDPYTTLDLFNPKQWLQNRSNIEEIETWKVANRLFYFQPARLGGDDVNSCYYSWLYTQKRSFYVVSTSAFIFFITVEPASKAIFVLGCIQTRLMGQYNGKWPISLVYKSKPLITVIAAIGTLLVYTIVAPLSIAILPPPPKTTGQASYNIIPWFFSSFSFPESSPHDLQITAYK